MGLYSMRSGKDAFMFRLALAAHNRGLTPNTLTALGLAFGIASGICFALHTFPIAFAMGLSSVFFDVLDGTLARKFHLETKFGLVFDAVADRVTEAAVVVGALVAGIINPLGLFAIVGSSCLLIFRALSYRRGLKTDYVLFGRFERLLAILVGLLSPFVLVSSLCFVLAGGFGLISSSQIAFSVIRRKS